MEPSPTAPPFDWAAVPAGRPAPRPPVRLLGRVVAGLTVLVLSALAVLLALVAAFELPPLLHPTLMPRLAIAYGLAVIGNLLLAECAGRATGSRTAGIVPALAWLGTVAYFAWGRTEGDSLYLLQTYVGVFFLPVGMFGAAIGLARAQRRRRAERGS